MKQEDRESITAIAERLKHCERVLFITGAGLSADSGLPTYRGVGGLYDSGLTDDGVTIEEALSGAMMRRDPALCWKYIMQIEEACRNAGPNAGHKAIAALEAVHDEVWVLTQNVDGFHQAAGSTRVIDIHGDVRTLLCASCDERRTVDDYCGLPALPHCDTCAVPIRPDVVLFGEMLPAAKLARLQEQLERGFDAVFSVGTTSVFPYIAAPVVHARRTDALTVEINPGLTEVSSLVDEKLAMGAARALSAITEAAHGFSS